MNKKRALYFTRFEYSPSLGGGCRRYAQIIDDLSPAFKMDILSTRDNETFIKAKAQSAGSQVGKPKTSWGAMLSRAAKYFLSGGQKKDIYPNIPWSGEFAAMSRYSLFGHYWEKNVNLEGYEVIFLDDPILFPEIVSAARAARVPVIGFCQNLETLAEGQIEYGDINSALHQELDLLVQLDLVVAISYEEAILLNNVGAKVYWLPYYPVEHIVSRMTEVGSRRLENCRQHGELSKASGEKKILFMGSIGNLPTRIGLEFLLSEWKSQNIFKRTGYKLVVTGYGTDELQKTWGNSEGMRILGSMKDSDLSELLVEVSAVIVYQKKGAGALTKINENLIAGIPTLSNIFAARSHMNIKGVHVFADDLHDLPELLAALEQNPGNDLAPIPKPDASLLINAIGACIGTLHTDDQFPKF